MSIMKKWIQNYLRRSMLYVKIRRYGLVNTIRRLYYHRVISRMSRVCLSDQSAAQPCEVHVLTSVWDWDLALWALRSFYQNSMVDWPLVIHDGGGLGQREWSCIREHFPKARLLGAEQSDKMVEQWLAERKYSAISRARGKYNLMRKIVDTTIACQAPRFILLDSDVLFFRKPHHLVRLAREETRHIHLLRDYQDSYSIDRETALEKIGVNLPPAVNTGLALVPVAAVDFDALEGIFNKDVIPLDKDGFAEQTVVALIASLSGFEYLPVEYKVVTGPSPPGSDICRHYVGPVKRLFFDEGVPIYRALKNGKQ